jgi:hypothetical protein
MPDFDGTAEGPFEMRNEILVHAVSTGEQRYRDLRERHQRY